MTVSREAVVAAARGWVGTPFHHQARLKGVGVDCAGVLIGVAHELGLSHYDIDGYGREPHAGLAEAEAARELEPIPLDRLQPGDVLQFRIERQTQHFGIVTTAAPEIYFVHALIKVGRVVETRLDRFWRPRVTGAYRFPGAA